MSNIFDKIISSDEFREEFFIAESQAKIAEMLDDKGVSRAEFARRLGVSRARVSQILSDEAKNFTLRLLVRGYLALGEEPVVLPRAEYEALKNKSKSSAQSATPGVRGLVDGMAEELIASLLRANLNGQPLENDKPQRRLSGAKDWALPGSNVVPFAVRSNG